MYDICDVHSHVLPGMDDGCVTAEESVAVLEQMWESGIKRVFATPHYYARETVDRFLERRQASLEQLRQAGETRELPALCCGAEVAWFPGIGNHPEISRLCLGRSRYLLLELPFTPWSAQTLRDVDNLCLMGFTPILAHYERYTRCQSRQMLRKMLESGPLVQMNASQVLDFWKGPAARAALRSGAVHLLGSDCHGLHHRPPRLGKAIALLEKKKMQPALEQVEQLSGEIFREAQG